MNLPILAAAAALLIAAPASLYTYYSLEPAGADGADATFPPSDSGASGLLRVRVHHDGDAGVATLDLPTVDGGRATRTIDLVPGEESVVEIALPPAMHVVKLAAEFGTSSLGGETDADLGACPAQASEVLFATSAAPRVPPKSIFGALQPVFGRVAYDVGIVVLPGECLPGPARYIAQQTIGVSASAPYPLCPLQCTVSYGFFGDGGLFFEVPDGARGIDIVAWWRASTPATERLGVGLYAPMDESGGWMGVARGDGAEKVLFSHDAPEPGPYAVFAHLDRPGAGLSQDVWLQAIVHT